MASDPRAAAVVDLGTNTFHLLVGYVDDAGQLRETYRERHFVKLADEGIDVIGEASARRAEAACRSLGEALAREAPVRAVAFGTAALRTAANGPALRARLAAALGVEIQVIDGRREAQLIARGVEAAGLDPARRSLIVDIGGGSVEFILYDGGAVRFSESYPVGGQVMRRRFHVREPFGKTQYEALARHLDEVLAPVRAAVGEAPVTLVGASGTFDVLGDLYGEPPGGTLRRVGLARVHALFAEVAAMDERERLDDARIPADRADMLPVALGLVDYVARRLPVSDVYACAYALKEGALYELERPAAT